MDTSLLRCVAEGVEGGSEVVLENIYGRGVNGVEQKEIVSKY
jgi:hypothetical protein